MRAGALTAGCVVALLVAACSPVSLALASEGDCSNEARRAEQSSTYLADCRAYEQVSPIEKDSGEPRAVEIGLVERSISEPVRGARAATDGERMAWMSEYSLPGLAGPSSPGLYYLSTRGPEGWSTEATVPPQSPENGLLCSEKQFMAGWSADLTKGILNDGDAQEGLSQHFRNQGQGCGHDEPLLVEGEPEGFDNLFLRDSEHGSYRLINVTPSTAPSPTPKEEGQEYFPPQFQAGSAELGHVVFEDELPLTEEAEKLSPAVEAACKETPKGRGCWEGHDDLYVWSEGQQPEVRLVTVLPDGTPVEGILAGSTRNDLVNGTNVADYRHAVSGDGSRIFFAAEGGLYARENGGQPQSAIATGSTAVNGEQCTEAERACTIRLDLPEEGAPGSGGARWLGASADGTTVFFTDDASAGLTNSTQAGSGINLYEYQLPRQADRPGVLIDLTPDAKAQVLGMSGISEDGSYAYFVAEGVLAGNATAEEPNLYVSHDGVVNFIATLNASDLCDWTSEAGCNVEQPSDPSNTGLTARVSGNGQFLAFNSINQSTGYDNLGPSCVELHGPQRFVSGACEEIFLYEAEADNLACVSCNPNGAPVADGAALDFAPAVLANAYPQRNVSETGQVFFETSEPLLSQQDTDGLRDVYEWEHGALHLISSGRSNAPSYFMEATPSGGDVFFATPQQLVPRDGDSAYDVYNARVGGGFSEPVASGPPCSGDECRGAPEAVHTFESPPASAMFSGSGNLPAPPEPAGAPKRKPLSRAQKLAKALKVCRTKHNRHKRAVCESRARKKYRPGSRAKKSARSDRSGAR